MHNNQLSTASTQEELSLLDIFIFLKKFWRWLITASLVGGFLGFAGWFFLGGYSAEYLLRNGGTFKGGEYTLNLIEWKSLQRALPGLASQIIGTSGAPDNLSGLYLAMSDEFWWLKNVTPNFTFTKSDNKELFIDGNRDATPSSNVLSFLITTSAPTHDQSIANALAVAEFIKSGGSYLQLKSLINDYELDSVATLADLRQKITANKIEMSYQENSLKNLEALNRRYPGNGLMGQQVVDAKDSAAKYLPIQTQIIAANNNINITKELLERLHGREAQLILQKQFTERASVFIRNTTNGLSLVDQLLSIIGDLHKAASARDLNNQEFLDDANARLWKIKARFSYGLEPIAAPKSNKRGMFKSTLAGALTALILMFAFLIGRRTFENLSEASKRVQPNGMS